MSTKTAKTTREAAATKPATEPETVNAGQSTPADAASQEVIQAVPCVAVWFDYVRADATRGTDRVYIQGVYDIRYCAQLEQYERMLVEQSNGLFLKVSITNWRSLEG